MDDPCRRRRDQSREIAAEQDGKECRYEKRAPSPDEHPRGGLRLTCQGDDGELRLVTELGQEDDANVDNEV